MYITHTCHKRWQQLFHVLPELRKKTRQIGEMNMELLAAECGEEMRAEDFALQKASLETKGIGSKVTRKPFFHPRAL